MNLPDIPTSYDTLKFTKYIEIINNLQAEKPDDYDTDDWNEYITYVTLSILLDKPVEEVKKFPNGNVFKMMNDLKFLDKLPVPGKSKMPLISLEEVPYDTFVNYQKLRLNQFENMTEILSLLLNGKTKEEIEQLTVQEVTDCFFTLNKSMVKSLNSSLISSAWAVMKMKMKIKEWMKKLFTRPANPSLKN